MGDFNAHLNGYTFITTSQMCSCADSSYIPYDKSSSSVIDHVIVSNELSYFIKYCMILDDNCINVSSHRPIVFNIELICYENVTPCLDVSVKWHRVSQL